MKTIQSFYDFPEKFDHGHIETGMRLVFDDGTELIAIRYPSGYINVDYRTEHQDKLIYLHAQTITSDYNGEKRSMLLIEDWTKYSAIDYDEYFLEDGVSTCVCLLKKIYVPKFFKDSMDYVPEQDRKILWKRKSIITKEEIADQFGLDVDEFTIED